MDQWEYEKARFGPQRKRMKRFGLNEISAVDTPAQEGARIALMKNHSTPEGIRQLERAAKKLEARADKTLAKTVSRVDDTMSHLRGEVSAEALRLQGEAVLAEWESEAPEREATRAKQQANAAALVARGNWPNNLMRGTETSDEFATEDETQEFDMTEKNVSVDTELLAEAIAITKGCDLGTAYKSIAVAERMGEDAVQALFTPEVQAALGVNDHDLAKARDQRADEIRKSGDRRTMKASRQTALREQVYRLP